MKLKLLLPILPGILALSVPNFAQGKEAAGITYDCDTTVDHFSELILPSNSETFTVTGKVRLITAAPSEKYLPLARISISSADAEPGPSSQSWAGFEYLVFPEEEGMPATLPFLTFSIRAEGSENQMELVAPPSSAEVNFELRLNEDVVEILIDGHSKKVNGAFEKPVVRIVCSTGEFLFTDLHIFSSD